MQHKSWWQQSMLVSTVLIAILVGLWINMNNYTTIPTQLQNEQEANQAIATWADHSISDSKPLVKIKTGVFIQSLQFFDSTEVNVSGYIWQHYPNNIDESLKPKEGEVGFILPEQVNSGSDISPREVYRISGEDEEVIGWYFEATVRQPFNYDRYPFDHKTVWLRMWSKDFASNVVLVPDFSAYKSTGLDDVFGIEKQIVLGAWERENTFFDYSYSDYDNNFGIDDYVGQTGFPELQYNFVVKRKFKNAFISYLLPLLLVAALLFAALLTVSGEESLSNKLGFNTSGFIGASSGLFFVVLLAHIQLREQFSAAGIVYIEYFYILMYAMLVVATANTYLFSINSKSFGSIILYKDNLIPKLLYWPLVFGFMIIITLYVM